MHDDGQIVFFGDFQLADENLALPRRIEAFDVEIQPNLADRDGAMSVEPGRQFGQVLIAMGADKQGVKAIRREGAFTRRTQNLDGLPVSPIDRRYDPAPHAGLAGPAEHRDAVFVERVVVQMRVGVYQIEHVSQRPVGL
jgi:hypothetical protein